MNKAISWNKAGHLSAILLAFVLPISTAATTGLAFFILLAWALGADWETKRRVLFRHPLVGWIYPIVILILISACYSIATPSAMRDGVIDGLRLCWIPLLIYFYRSEKTARLALSAFVLAMMITLVLAFLKVYGGLPIGLKYTTGAIFKSHIKTSFFMAMAAFFLAWHIKQSPRYRVFFGVWIALMIYYLVFMNVGRIGYITLVLCLGWLAWCQFRWKGIVGALLIGAGLIGSAYMSASVFSKRMIQDLDFYQQGSLIHSSLGSRLQFAESSLHLIAAHPWIGQGVGSFGEGYARWHVGEDTLLTDNPHNEYLRIGVELGTIGFLLLMALFYRQIWLSRALPLNWRVLCQGFLLTFMVGCLFNSWLKDFTEAYFYCVITAICFAPLLPPQKTMVKAVLH